MWYLSTPESIECQIQNCCASKIIIGKTQPYYKRKESLVLKTHTRGMKAEFLFVETDSPNQDQPEYRTENENVFENKEEGEEKGTWSRARQ